MSNKGESVHEYDVVANGYETILNLTEADAERLYPDAKKRSGPLAPDHRDVLSPKRDEGKGDEKGQAGSKARTAPNK